MQSSAGSAPYRVEGPAIINFSGGRSSGYMLRRILDAWGGTLPANLPVVFCNTGKERAETLDFVARIQSEWGVRIRWVEYRYRNWAAGGIREPKNSFEEVGHNTASRDGRPFEELIDARGFLPSPVQRICTSEMKVNTAARFVRAEFGWRKFRRILGLRYDERKRWGRLLYTDCDAVCPMVEAEATKGDVLRFWRASPFDLGIPSERGNCDLCFLKGDRNIIETIREKPELADWWIDQERKIAYGRDTESGRKDSHFTRYRTFSDLRDAARLPPERSLLDAFSDEELDDCSCTD